MKATELVSKIASYMNEEKDCYVVIHFRVLINLQRALAECLLKVLEAHLINKTRRIKPMI